MHEERPKAPTKVRSFTIDQLLLKICARFLKSCNTFDEANQESKTFIWNGEGWRKFCEVKWKNGYNTCFITLKVSRKFGSYSDTSHKGIGCVLMQHNKIIVCVTRQPKPHEQKYPTHKLGLVEIIFVLKDWGNMICMEKGVKSIWAINVWNMYSRGKAKVEASDKQKRRKRT